jgi:hypothetical protein
MPVAISIFRLEYDKKALKKIIGDNPDYKILKIVNPIFKQGFLDIEIPEKLLTMGLNIKVNVPKEFLVDDAKPCKIGSYVVETPPKGRLAKNKVLKFLATHLTTIDLFIA